MKKFVVKSTLGKKKARIMKGIDPNRYWLATTAAGSSFLVFLNNTLKRAHVAAETKVKSTPSKSEPWESVREYKTTPENPIAAPTISQIRGFSERISTAKGMAKRGPVLLSTAESPGDTYCSPRIQAAVERDVTAAIAMLHLLTRTLFEMMKRKPPPIKYLRAMKRKGEE